MTTATIRESETTAMVAEPLSGAATPAAVAAAPATAVAPSTAAPPADAVDVSAIPETPRELLKQWDASRRPLLHTVIAAIFVRIWDGLTGPGMTERERVNRAVAEHNGYARTIGRNV